MMEQHWEPSPSKSDYILSGRYTYAETVYGIANASEHCPCLGLACSRRYYRALVSGGGSQKYKIPTVNCHLSELRSRPYHLTDTPYQAQRHLRRYLKQWDRHWLLYCSLCKYCCIPILRQMLNSRLSPEGSDLAWDEHWMIYRNLKRFWKTDMPNHTSMWLWLTLRDIIRSHAYLYMTRMTMNSNSWIWNRFDRWKSCISFSWQRDSPRNPRKKSKRFWGSGVKRKSKPERIGPLFLEGFRRNEQ